MERQVHPVGVTHGPFGPLHGTSLQQSDAAVQCWPKSAHGIPASLGPPPSFVPASGGTGGGQGPQIPSVLPTGSMQVSPTQQSALVVHLPHEGTHALW
jgi:hypothetical protein